MPRFNNIIRPHPPPRSAMHCTPIPRALDCFRRGRPRSRTHTDTVRPSDEFLSCPRTEHQKRFEPGSRRWQRSRETPVPPRGSSSERRRGRRVRRDELRLRAPFTPSAAPTAHAGLANERPAAFRPFIMDIPLPSARRQRWKNFVRSAKRSAKHAEPRARRKAAT